MEDDIPAILAHYNEKVEQETSSHKPPFYENDDEKKKRKVKILSFECKRQIMASIYHEFKSEVEKQKKIYGENAAADAAASAVNFVITKTLLRFRDMHEKLKSEARDGNDVEMKIRGITEILDFIESFRKQLDYRVSDDLQLPQWNNKNDVLKAINRALKTVNAFIEQMSTLLSQSSSQSSKETEDAKLNPLKNIVVFLNEVKKIIVGQKQNILKWFETHQSDETHSSPAELRKLVQDVRDDGQMDELLPTGKKATKMQEVDGGRKKRNITGRKRTGKKRGRTNKKRKSITRCKSRR